MRELVGESVPWGHHVLLLDKVTDPAARLYYLRATAQFGWSRNVLLNQIKAGAYERAVTEKKTHNFPLALPEHLAEQADEMLKSSYNLEFLGIRRAVKERELEDRLISRLQAFILELGYGFCFVGRQYRLALGEKEYFIDLLFYHRFLKALVAFDLKVGPFEPEYAGKMDFYLNLLNDTGTRRRRPAVDRHHPLRGKGRRGGGVCPAHENQSHRRGRLSTPVEIAGRSEGQTADGQTACRRRADGSARKEGAVTQYVYRCQPPTPAKELLAEFWKLEKEAEKMLEGLAK